MAMPIRGQDSNHRYYDDGPLTLDDFLADPLDVDSLIGQIYFDYKMNTNQLYIDGVKLEISELSVLVNREHSWIRVNQVSENTINYFQVLYDIEYLMAIKYNKTLREKLDVRTDAIDKILRDKNIMKEKFYLESAGGQRDAIIVQWANRINAEIDSFKLTKQVVDYNAISKSGFAMSVGANRLFLSDDLDFYFGDLWGFEVSFDLKLKHHYLMFMADVGIGMTKNLLPGYPRWDAGLNQLPAFIKLSYGYQFKLSNSLAVRPFAGVGLLQMAINSKYENLYPDINDSAWNISGGVLLDFAFSRRYGEMQGLRMYAYPTKIYSEHGIRLKFSYIPSVSIFDQYPGSGVGLSLSYYYYFGSFDLVRK